MDKINAKIFYGDLDTHSKIRKICKVPSSVFRQELVTWEYTDIGIKRTTVVRSFDSNCQKDSYISEPISFKKTS